MAIAPLLQGSLVIRTECSALLGAPIGSISGGELLRKIVKSVRRVSFNQTSRRYVPLAQMRRGAETHLPPEVLGSRKLGDFTKSR